MLEIFLLFLNSCNICWTQLVQTNFVDLDFVLWRVKCLSCVGSWQSLPVKKVGGFSWTWSCVQVGKDSKTIQWNPQLKTSLVQDWLLLKTTCDHCLKTNIFDDLSTQRPAVNTGKKKLKIVICLQKPFTKDCSSFKTVLFWVLGWCFSRGFQCIHCLWVWVLSLG